MAEVEKITEQDLTGLGVTELPDMPEITSAELKRKFEEILRDVVIPKVNEAIDALNIKAEISETTSVLKGDGNGGVTAAVPGTDFVAPVEGKGLSANDYTTAEKAKLGGIAAGAEVNVQSDMSQNDATAKDYIKNKPTSLPNPYSLTFGSKSYNGSSAVTLSAADIPLEVVEGLDSDNVQDGIEELNENIDEAKSQLSESIIDIYDGKIKDFPFTFYVSSDYRIADSNEIVPLGTTIYNIDGLYDMQVEGRSEWVKDSITFPSSSHLRVRLSSKEAIEEHLEHISTIIYTKKDADFGTVRTDINTNANDIRSNKNAIQTGYYTEVFDGKYNISSDPRIVYLNNGQAFSESIHLYVATDGYDLGTTTVYGEGITDWSNSVLVNVGKYVAIRRSAKTNFGGDYAEELKNVVITKEPSKIAELESEIEKVGDNASKFAHISFDDSVVWADFITNSASYSSIYDNDFISALKELHDAYGATFTLNCFCASNGNNIQDLPTKFQTQFSQAKKWLRFAFHAQDGNTRYDTDSVSAITTSYNNFTTGIYNLTGDTECIDRVTRLGFFTGTLANVKAIRDCNCGIVGLLTADDTKVSYYLDTDKNDYILHHAKMTDTENQIVLIKSQSRIEGVSNPSTWANQFKTVAYGNMANYLEFFTHEYEWNDALKDKLDALCQWCVDNGYKFGFMQNILKL